MARIGKIPVVIPDKITVNLKENTITIKGPKGELSRSLPDCITVTQEENAIKVSPANTAIQIATNSRSLQKANCQYWF